MQKLSKITTEQLEELLGFLKYTNKLPTVDSKAFQHLKTTLTNYLDHLISDNPMQFLSILKQINISEKEARTIFSGRKPHHLSYGQIAAKMILDKQNTLYQNWKDTK